MKISKDTIAPTKILGDDRQIQIEIRSTRTGDQRKRNELLAKPLDNTTLILRRAKIVVFVSPARERSLTKVCHFRKHAPKKQTVPLCGAPIQIREEWAQGPGLS
jgi:hypothetical protein